MLAREPQQFIVANHPRHERSFPVVESACGVLVKPTRRPFDRTNVVHIHALSRLAVVVSIVPSYSAKQITPRRVPRPDEITDGPLIRETPDVLRPLPPALGCIALERIKHFLKRSAVGQVRDAPSDSNEPPIGAVLNLARVVYAGELRAQLCTPENWQGLG
jgi:hypothetical protein